MSDLHRTIARLAEDFAANVLTALSTASLSDIATIAGSAPARATPRASTVAANVPSNDRAPRARRVKKRSRRSAKDLQGTVDAIVAALKKSIEGMRSEQIQRALGLSKNDVTQSLEAAIANRAVKKKGQRRGTTYFAA